MADDIRKARVDDIQDKFDRKPEKILGAKIESNQVFFLIKWQNSLDADLGIVSVLLWFRFTH